MRWVIHIGMQKTGSKAIQDFLANQAAKIPDVRLLFAPQGREGIWHLPLYWALREGNGSDLQAAVSETNSKDWDIGVFSSEDFYRLPPRSVEIIQETLGDAQIILFLRSQPDLINSLLNQFAKAHRVSADECTIFERELRKYDPEFDYRAVISKWSDVFGCQAITPIIYKKGGGDSVRLFCDAIGVAVPTTYQFVANSNPALSKSAYDAFLAAKSSVPLADLPVIVDRLHRDFSDQMIDTFRDPGPMLFDERTRQEIVRNYATSNEWVRAQWFPSRPVLFD
jgi:hypothetical protein